SLHLGDAVGGASFVGFGTRPPAHELAPREPLTEAVLGRNGHQRLGCLARPLRLPAKLREPARKQPRDAPAARIRPLPRAAEPRVGAAARPAGPPPDPGPP